MRREPGYKFLNPPNSAAAVRETAVKSQTAPPRARPRSRSRPAQSEAGTRGPVERPLQRRKPRNPAATRARPQVRLSGSEPTPTLHLPAPTSSNREGTREATAVTSRWPRLCRSGGDSASELAPATPPNCAAGCGADQAGSSEGVGLPSCFTRG